MTYNQVQLFQVNDYANHYVDIEITGYRELYSENCKQQCGKKHWWDKTDIGEFSIWRRKV